MTGVDDIIRTIEDSSDDFFPGEEEQIKSENALRKIESELSLRQMDLNLQEAKHKSVFVAGWRPFIGWVCGCALAYNFILRDIIMVLFQVNAQDLPALSTGPLITVLGGMLGLGTLRTVEKFRGVQSDSLDPNSGLKEGGLFKRFKKNR